ncbi:MAG: RluA family pseudouridine synthase [Rickettsiales bacterium]|jgi:23S rRNA pseudouridine1911/1915/1917 synthase|nr:RluA family pseudouridine synthase [Rickettsiales bacterium]
MQENIEKQIIECEEEGIRLDKFLTIQLNHLSRSQVQELITKKQVMCEGKAITNPSTKTKLKSYEINAGYIKPKPSHLLPYDYPLNIVFEDEYLMVLNKPTDLIVHPGAGNYDKTLANALVHYAKDSLSKIGGDFRPGIVHRLDKDTTGLIIIAKDDETHKVLSAALSERDIKRHYLALVFGCPELLAGTIKTHIAKYKHDHSKMIVTKASGKEAITHYVVKNTLLNKKFSLIECKLDTGRTHQIRVHLNYKGFPVVGDQLYNAAQSKYLAKLSPNLKTLVNNFKRQALHAYKLEFIHPITNELMEFEIDLPQDIQELCQELEKHSV